MDFTELQAAFARNVETYPAVLRVLADDLGVTAASLQRLGVGLAPRVRFVKGYNTQGWWSTPERNSEGYITGLSLRGITDGSRKPMYFGSKHGLIYPIAQDFDPDQGGYEPGAHNWIRPTAIGAECPVCGKPDGCLLSAEDPTDPQAVICIRKQSGCVRPMKMGFLHILKAEGRVVAGGPLPGSEHPVVIVEGLSDTAAALDLGFVAIGRSSAGFTTGLPDLCKGRPVIIVGENDAPDKFGRQAGIEGMETVFDLLSPLCPSVVKVTPPDGYKDLRQWKSAGLTRETFLSHVESQGSVTATGELLPSGDPLPVARVWLRDQHWDHERDLPLLRQFYGDWYRYDGVVYRECSDDKKLRGELYTWLDGKRFLKGADELVPYVPTRARINDVIDALTAHCPIPDEPPCWIGGDKADPRNMIVYQNGILHVDRYLSGEDHALTPLTPAFFTMNVLPYDFNPDATCPTWERYLATTFTKGEDHKRDLLQEWFGYCMVADVSLEKMLLLYGRSGSGKSTAIEAFGALLGRHQIAPTKMRSLGEQYGLHSLVGKLAAVIPDLRIPRNADSMQALENILTITGGDVINVPRKYKTDLTDVRLMTRLLIAGNELPELPDHAQALARRMMIIEFKHSFRGREDTSLKTTLPTEASGISLWALEGLRRLRANGRFSEGEDMSRLLHTMQLATSPVAEFVEDCLVLDPTSTASFADLFAVWCGWCHERSMRPGHKTRFEQRLATIIPSLERCDDWEQRKKIYQGAEITTVAQRRFMQ